jgi:hypothetical protein
MPIRMPSAALKTTQAARKDLAAERDLGMWMELRMRGTAGRRNRGSWCGLSERKNVADRAERRGSCVARERGRRNKAGPRRRGSETTK